MRMTLTFLRFVWARFRGRALDLEFGHNRWILFPDGSSAPVIAGASDPEPDPDEPERDPDPEPDDLDPDDDPGDPDDPDPDPAPKPDGKYDEERAMRTIKRQRAEAKRLKAERDAEKARADELARANETEQEKTVRERDEAKAQAEAERSKSERMLVNEEIRDIAADLDVPPKKVKRLLRLVDRENITITDDGVEGVEEALESILDEFPEFVEAPKPPPSDDDDPPDDRRPEPTGGNPDRRRGSGEMTVAQASRMARVDPHRFAEMLAEGKIPKDALGNKRYQKLKDEGRLDVS